MSYVAHLFFLSQQLLKYLEIFSRTFLLPGKQILFSVTIFSRMGKKGKIYSQQCFRHVVPGLKLVQFSSMSHVLII